MIRASVNLTFAACADDVAGTILLIAKKRAAAMNAFLFVRLRRIGRRIWSLWITRDSAFVCKRLVIVRAIPVTAPFPHVAGHVINTVPIWWKRFHGRNPGVTVFASIFHWKFPLPGVGHPFAAGAKFVAPHIHLS